MPPFLERGGSYRRLIVVPQESSGGRSLDSWRITFGDEATLVAAPGHDVVTVCEGWNLPLVNIGLNLIQRRRDYADFAERVHTRSDVSWTPLTSLLAAAPLPIAPAANAFSGLGNNNPTVTQIL